MPVVRAKQITATTTTTINTSVLIKITISIIINIMKKFEEMGYDPSCALGGEFGRSKQNELFRTSELIVLFRIFLSFLSPSCGIFPTHPYTPELE